MKQKTWGNIKCLLMYFLHNKKNPITHDFSPQIIQSPNNLCMSSIYEKKKSILFNFLAHACVAICQTRSSTQITWICMLSARRVWQTVSGNLLLDNKNNVVCKSNFHMHQRVQTKNDFHYSISRHICYTLQPSAEVLAKHKNTIKLKYPPNFISWLTF